MKQTRNFVILSLVIIQHRIHFVQQEDVRMQKFHISLRSFQDVQEFISLATVQPFAILVGNEAQQVNGKSFIGMVSLDHSRPLLVQADCDCNAWQKFRSVVDKFLAE